MTYGVNVKSKNRIEMIRKIILIISTASFLFSLSAQEREGETPLKREVTLYNPYKPSLPDFRKKSFLPDIVDTLSVSPSFSYDVKTTPYTPTYSISSIRPASLLPDPLPKLYKSYVKLGLGNNNTPLAELSITNGRSKRGAIGLYAKHYSSNGKVPLENDQKVFAGFMDNDATLFGKKFFRKSTLDVSLDFMQKTRYAYGYETQGPLYEPDRKDIRLDYYDIGGGASFSSVNLDSSDFAYDFGISYDYFRNEPKSAMNHIAFDGYLATEFEGFYLGSDIDLDSYTFSDTLNIEPKYVFSVSPFFRRSTGQWTFDLGVELLLDKNLKSSPAFHFYPDLKFGFTVVQDYMNFFAELGGGLERNDPLSIIRQNPFILGYGTIFNIPNTSQNITLTAGLKGNNGIGGNYLASVSYSQFEDMLFLSNIIYPDTASRAAERGNRFVPLTDEGNVINIHGEFTGSITPRLSFNAAGNFYKYTLLQNDIDYAWTRPDWDGRLGLKYNLRDKIIAGLELNALGSRKMLISKSLTGWTTTSISETEEPVHVNLGISAEYRYTKILSFWARINNMSYQRYYEWAFYPSQMFNFLIGFTYSL